MEVLAGKVAVVTGAASGIGLALARRLAAEGMHLVISDVEEPALARAAAELEDGGARALAVATDVARADAVDELARRTFAEFGTAHVVCNNAGVASRGFATWEAPLSTWTWVLGVNLWGVVHGIRAFVPRMIEQDDGHVVNIASLAGLTGPPMLAPYVASKHAVVGISETLHHDLAQRGSAVGVSVVCPGVVTTRIGEAARNWPDHLGAPAAEGPGAAAIAAALGRRPPRMDPAEIADCAVEAIRQRRFLVLPHAAEGVRALENRLALAHGVPPILLA